MAQMDCPCWVHTQIVVVPYLATCPFTKPCPVSFTRKNIFTNPLSVKLLDPVAYKTICFHLYRLQRLSSRESNRERFRNFYEYPGKVAVSTIFLPGCLWVVYSRSNTHYIFIIQLYKAVLVTLQIGNFSIESIAYILFQVHKR